MSEVFNLSLSKIRETPDLVKGVDPTLIFLLSDMEEYIGEELIIHLLLDREHSNPRSQHLIGRAADLHVRGINLVDQFLHACRFPFTGIGVYSSSVWNNPGLHLDIRQLPNGSPRALWSCTKKGSYGRLNSKFLLSSEKVQA